MLRIYRAPNGHKYQFEEGTQPDGYELADKPARPARKRRTTANKARKTDNK